MTAYERMNAEYRAGKGDYIKVAAKDLGLALNLIDAVKIIDRTFEAAGVSGIIADYGPVYDALKMLLDFPSAKKRAAK